eukprot:Rmarinus@m.14082
MSKEKGEVWLRSELQGLRAKYKHLAYDVAHKSALVVAAARQTGSADADRMAKVVMEIANAYGRSFSIVNALIGGEFKFAKSKNTILRMHTVASRAAWEYSQRIGREYLKEVLGPTVKDLMNVGSLEIDPNKMSHVPESERNDLINENTDKLLDKASMVLENLVESLPRMPRGLRAIAGVIHDMAVDAGIEPEKLVGGFFMLRYVNPALLAPEAHGLLPEGVIPSPQSRRNLILISKLLQNLSNNVEFGDKEAYMFACNSFIFQYRDIVSKFLSEMAVDPKCDGVGVPWSDMQEVGNKEELPLAAFDLKDLIFLHRVFSASHAKYKDGVPRELAMFVDHMGGPPRDVRTNSLQNESFLLVNKSLKEAEKKIHQSVSRMSSGVRQLPENAVYSGPSNKNGHPVMYIILCRIPDHFFDDVGVLVRAVAEAAGSIIRAGPFALCVDFSWLHWPPALRDGILESVPAFVEETSKVLGFNNCDEVYFVHPGDFGYELLCKLESYVPPSVSEVIYEVHRAKGLSKWIIPANIALPEHSKRYFTDAFFVGKINRKGKVQFRVAKITSSLLFNIEPNTRAILNVRHLSKVEKLVFLMSGDRPTLILHFDEPKRRKGFNALLKKEVVDRRIYMLESIYERDELAEKIISYMMGSSEQSIDTKKGPRSSLVLKAGTVDPDSDNEELTSSTTERSFAVSVINSKKQQKPRLITLTARGMLLLTRNAKELKKEISYDAVMSVETWRSNPQVLELTIGNDCKKLNLESPHSEQIRDLLQAQLEVSRSRRQKIRQQVERERMNFFLALMAVMRWRAKIGKNKAKAKAKRKKTVMPQRPSRLIFGAEAEKIAKMCNNVSQNSPIVEEALN